MRSLKQVARLAFHGTGGFALARALRPAAPRILTYHRFPQAMAETLAGHCEYLRRHYEPVPLSEMIAGLQREKPLSARAVAVTIDDGYRDIYEVAFPVFRRYGIPATAFLATGFLDRECWLWVDQVRYAIEQTACSEVELDERRLPLTTPEAREHAIAEVKQTAKRWPDALRRCWLTAMSEQLGVATPQQCPSRFAPLDWDQVREMRRGGIEFGAHTITHPILSRLENRAHIEREIAGSKQRIETELQEPVAVFCYPNGRFTDIGEETKSVVRDAGFRGAVTTEAGPNTPGVDPFLLRRIGVDATDSPLYFRERVACISGC